MKLGILGSGEVAKTLAGGFLKHGHEAMLGTRDAAKLAGWSKQNPRGRIGSFREAAAFGEVVVLAVKGGTVDIRVHASVPRGRQECDVTVDALAPGRIDTGDGSTVTLRR